MKRFAGRSLYGLLAILIILVLLICDQFFYKANTRDKESARIYNVFAKKVYKLENLIDSVSIHLMVDPKILSDWSLLHFFQPNEEGLEIAVSTGKGLVFWSSSSIAFPVESNHTKKSNGLIHLPTGWYFQLSGMTGIYTIRGYVLIKREFPYHNRYIRSTFDRDFAIPDDFQVLATPHPDAINITQPDGKFLFSLKNGSDAFKSAGKSNITALLSYIFILLILLQINVWLKHNRKIQPNLKLFIPIFVCIVIYLTFSGFKFPEILYQTNLFSPASFAYDSWLSSLGEFILLSILMFHVAQSFLTLNGVKQDPARRQIRKIFGFFFAAFYFSFSVALLKVLLMNSSVSLEFFNNLKFSEINFYAFVAISLQVLGFIILAWHLRRDFCNEGEKDNFLLLLFGFGFFAGIVISLTFCNIGWTPFIYYAIVLIILSRFSIHKIKEYRFTFLLIMSILSASYLNLYAQDLIQEKNYKILDMWAVKLSSERDAGAEIFLSELDSKFQKDTLIRSHLFPPYKTLDTYFQNTYFTGFWRNYNLQITVCTPKDSVFITDENRHYPCIDFFNNLRESKGMLVTGSNFYFMDRLNGRISYLGQLDVMNSMNVPVKIFIELNSKVIPEGKGYPELLLDEHATRENQDGDFSYAKYFDGELVDRGGDFQYSMKLPENIPSNQEYFHFSSNGYRHCAYNKNWNNYVIASYPEMHIYDWISTFPYLFLMFFLLGSVLLSLNQMNLRIRNKPLDFREKIQLTLILSLLGILIIIGLGLMLYNSKKLLNSVKDNLNEKLMSVTSELSMRIDQDVELNAPMHDSMNEQLVILSDILRSDINLYDLNGNLFATSRSEIFDRGLMSRRINPVAFQAISVGHKTLFLHDENLGEMNFFSAYSPIYNQNNKLIGYVNLPYFTGHDDFEKQVSDFIVAFSNLYILLIIISLVVALIISNKLTAPLLTIENYLKAIKLGKTNAKIEYSGEDEIGRLANEYNKKVDELAESAELLARSERESAWQEMARQVAHEINNPLTPMKLSIQYLQRIKEQNSENFDEYFYRVSRTLVEQIDALSLIASSFSDFAKMPVINYELINLNDKIREVMLLFENTNNVVVSFNITSDAPVNIIGDKDQLGRAVINLVKNGIQAIPRDRKGFLKVKLYNDDTWAYLSISDNGVGIPFELQDKLFEPSFTTKSSGMGLGLAIAKKIIENLKGEIWFQSTRDVETIFFIKLPLSVQS